MLQPVEDWRKVMLTAEMSGKRRFVDGIAANIAYLFTEKWFSAQIVQFLSDFSTVL